MTTAPDPEADVESMETRGLVDAILDLEQGQEARITDAGLAQEVASHVKDHVDELVALRAGGQAGPATPRRRQRSEARDLPTGPVPDLASAPPTDQARWIFLERFIALEKHEELLGLTFESEEFARYQEAFDRLIKDLLLLPEAMVALDSNDVSALQRLFASCIPLFRCSELGEPDGGRLATAVANLRAGVASFFYKRRKRPNWFERQGFYAETLPGPRWVLVDTENLNCTLRRPRKKLAAYARGWELPPEYAQQKSIVEDIYDRILVGQALGEDLFAGRCNSLTTTRYRTRRSRRLVYTVQKVHKITIHGKAGLPHWRARRRLWPGVYPTLVFSDSP